MKRFYWIRTQGTSVWHLREFGQTIQSTLCGYEYKGEYEYHPNDSYTAREGEPKHWFTVYLTDPDPCYCETCISLSPMAFAGICEKALREESPR